MVILVKLCIALSRHASVTHDHVHTVRNVNLHLSSRKWTLVDPKAVVEILRDTSRVRAAHLALTRQSIQDFVLRMGAEALLKVD